MMSMEIFNETKSDISSYEKLLKEVFAFNKESFSIILTTNKKIKDLNKSYRKVNKVTDVLSFNSDQEDYLGEVFIALKRAFRQAKAYRHSKKREVAFLAVHGYLHLKGYHHDTKEAEEEMLKKQEEILKKVNLMRGI